MGVNGKRRSGKGWRGQATVVAGTALSLGLRRSDVRELIRELQGAYASIDSVGLALCMVRGV